MLHCRKLIRAEMMKMQIFWCNNTPLKLRSPATSLWNTLRTQPTKLNGLNQGNRFHFRRWCYLNSDLLLANDVYCSVFFRVWSCRFPEPRGVPRALLPTSEQQECRPTVGPDSSCIKPTQAPSSLQNRRLESYDRCRLGFGSESDHPWTRGFTGTPNPDEKIPPKLNKQSKTDAADNHLNRLKPTVIIKRGFTQTTGRNHPRQQLRHAAACFHLEPKVTKQPHQETSLQWTSMNYIGMI